MHISLDTPIKSGYDTFILVLMKNHYHGNKMLTGTKERLVSVRAYDKMSLYPLLKRLFNDTSMERAYTENRPFGLHS
jgi:hypothetical protein